MKKTLLFIFLISFTISFILSNIFSGNLTETRHYLFSNRADIKQSDTVEIVAQKIRILCLIPTAAKNHQLRAIHVRETWGKHCDKLVFGSVITDNRLGSIGFNVSDEYKMLWIKMKYLLDYVHRNFIDEYDWFYKADDNSFAIIENMRSMLSAYSPNDPIYFGHKYTSGYHKENWFMLGGPGYVMSNMALRLLVEKTFRNNTKCPLERTFTMGEDWNIGHCLNEVGVYGGDSRDQMENYRFFRMRPGQHLFPDKKWDWYRWGRFYKSPVWHDPLSNYTISFHEVYPKYMYTLYYLIYNFHAYGIEHRFPPPPKQLNFTRVKTILEQERLKVKRV